MNKKDENKIGNFCGVNVVLSKDSYEEYKGTLNEQIEELQQRIDKAIEYIEKHKQIAMFADLRKEGTHQYTIECDADDLLSILRGEE